MVNSVEEWKEHTEISLGFKGGETHIGVSEWTKRIYESLCRGEVAFGGTDTNAIEALLLVVKEQDPDKYESALLGLKKTIRYYRERGKPLIRLAEMYERMGGKSFGLD